MRLHSDRYLFRYHCPPSEESHSVYREWVTIEDKETGKTKDLGVMPGLPIENILNHMNSLTDEQMKDWLKR